MSDRVVKKCEELWAHATSKGERTETNEADRESEGSYINGFKKHTEIWTVQGSSFVLRAERVQFESFRLAADNSVSWRELILILDGHEAFRAHQEGRRTVSRFEGADERFVGKETIDPQPWTVVSGELPEKVPE